jgi:hypothetical protein
LIKFIPYSSSFRIFEKKKSDKILVKQQKVEVLDKKPYFFEKKQKTIEIAEDF